jgi:hypothetical protein
VASARPSPEAAPVTMMTLSLTLSILISVAMHV